MKKPVSVVVPCYNDEKYIGECLDSIVNQEDADKLIEEVIVINNESTDNSQMIIDKYVEKYEFVNCINQENGGPSAARNTGVRNAKGDYLYFLDSDDYIAKDMIKNCYEAAASTNSDIVTFKTKAFLADGSEELTVQNYMRTMESKTYDGKEFFSYMINNNEFYTAVWLLFIKKDFYEKNNFYFLEGIIYEDTPFSYKAINCAEKVYFIDKTFHYRRTRLNSIIRSKIKPKHIYSNNVGIEFMANWYLEEENRNSASLNEELKFLQRIAAGNIITIMQSDNEGNKKKSEKKAYKAVLKKYPFVRSSQMPVCWLKGIKFKLKMLLKK